MKTIACMRSAKRLAVVFVAAFALAAPATSHAAGHVSVKPNSPAKPSAATWE